MSAPETETVRYLGCTLIVGAREVAVYAPDGKLIGSSYTVSGARRIAKGYRRG